MENVLEINDLSYSYRGNWSFKRNDAVQSLSLSVKKAESFGFLGHNGAGKTTTIKCILGLIKPSHGEIKIFGKPNYDLSTRKFVGYLPEQPYFYDYLTVNEIMQMYATLSGIPSSEITASIKNALEMVKVSARSKSPMRSLSKGLTQRVGLAQAIVGKPKLLILDEPFSGLDPIGRKEFRDIFVNLRITGTAIFICTHVLSDVEFLCDRVSIMANGKLKGIFDIRDKSSLGTGYYELVVRDFESVQNNINIGSIKIFQEQDARGKYLKLHYLDRKVAEDALVTAIKSGSKVESFEFVHGNLEDLFINLVKFEEAERA
ncbi:MAG: ABC transporter ATP-binding protein [bacterium]|nr:ABC transporter ATP-binding protein [bacterium]